MRGGAWVSYEEERHNRFLLQAHNSIKSELNPKGTLARPPGNNPRRLFFVREPERGTDKPEDPERAAPSSGTAAEPPHPDIPGLLGG